MSEKINNFDKETSVLIKKGLQKIPSDDFTKRIMNKIIANNKLEAKTSVNIKFAWLFIAITLVLLPFVIFFIAQNFHFIFPYLKEFTDPNMKFLVPVLILIICSIVLFQIENLIKLTIN